MFSSSSSGGEGRASGAGAPEALGPEGAVRLAEEAKEEGNAHLRRGELREAIARYKEGLEQLERYAGRLLGRAALGAALRARADAVRTALHLNLAQACLKQRDWAGAAHHADWVLQTDRSNLKALYRRAVARSHIDSQLEQACADFLRVLELDPSNAEAKEQLERTQEQLQTFYDVLAVPQGAAPSQIRQAYLREAKRWHPDKAESADKELAERRFKRIAEAHEVLRDDVWRQRYDVYLQCRTMGYVEFEDPEGTVGSVLHVAFKDWADFRRLLEQGVSHTESGQDEPDGHGPAASKDDPDDAPLSILEWMMGGGVLLAVWCFSVWRHNQRQWLKALPAEILDMHEEYSIPLGLLMSPFFFGNVPFEETVRWIRTMVGDALLH